MVLIPKQLDMRRPIADCKHRINYIYSIYLAAFQDQKCLLMVIIHLFNIQRLNSTYFYSLAMTISLDLMTA